MKFYGEKGEQGFNEGRTFIESALKMWLLRDLMPEEQWELDDLLGRLYRRMTNPRENELLRNLVVGGKVQDGHS